MKSFYFRLLSILLISCLGIIVYSDTFHCSFHFDDEFLLIDNLSLRHLSNLQGIWNFLPCRFIFYLSLALNYHFHQLDVFGYHVVNMALHIVTANLVWWLTLLTLSSPALNIVIKSNNRSLPKAKLPPSNPITKHANLIALLVGLIFVSHPIQTQAVTYIVQRAAIMVTLFYVATLCLYAKARLLPTHRVAAKFFYPSALLTAILAMYSKEIAITLPLMILLYEFCFFKTNKNLNWAYLLPFLMTIFIIPLTMYLTKNNSQAINSWDLRHAIEGTTEVSSTDYLFTQFRVIVTYIRLIFLPLNQNLDYDYPVSQTIFEWPTFLSLIFLIIVLYFAKRLFSKYRLVSFGIFWFFLSLMPESSIFPINDVIFEHRLYLPLVGFSMFLVSGAFYLFKEKNVKMMVIVLSLIIACNSVLAYQRNKIWIDDMTLLKDIVQKSPNKARPHNNLGNAYLKQGAFTQAIIEFNKAIELNPYYVEPLVNSGLIYDHQGNFTQALSDYTKAISLNPQFEGVYASRGITYNKQGKSSQAISDFTKAITLNPEDTASYFNRGSAYSNQCNFTQAIADFNKAITLNPNLVDAYYSRGLTYARHDDLSQAIADFTKAILLKADNAESYNNRGFMYVKQGNLTEALSDYNVALKLNPKLDIAYINRAVVYDKLKEYDNAWGDVHKAEKLGASINPDFIKTLRIESSAIQEK